MTATAAQIAYITDLQADKAHRKGRTYDRDAKRAEFTKDATSLWMWDDRSAAQEFRACYDATVKAAKAGELTRDEKRAQIDTIRAEFADWKLGEYDEHLMAIEQALTVDPATLTKEQASATIDLLKRA